MSPIRTSNNPNMLVWARKEVGYTIEQAAEAIGVSVENLSAAESGTRPLTLNQLRKAAEQYDFPFGYFYLAKPPHEDSFKPIPDYRIAPGLVGVDHHRLHLEIKKARDRRELFIDLIRQLDTEVKAFQLLSSRRPAHVGSFLRERLGVSDTEIASLSYDKVYSFWKKKIEDDRVLVYESQYIPETSGVIGAAIFYEAYPIILIKRGGDSNARKLFTLLHEYAHLLMGKSAINDAGSQIVDQSDDAVTALEVECNRLAAEILVPSERINLEDYSYLELVPKMERLASDFKVTYTTAAVCLRRFGLIDNSQLQYLIEVRRKAAKEEARTGKDKEVKIPRENLMRLDMGYPMFGAVLQAYATGLLDIFDASKILNLRVKKIDQLVSGMR